MTLFYPTPNITHSISIFYNTQYYTIYARIHIIPLRKTYDSDTVKQEIFAEHYNNKDGCHSRHPSLLFYVIQTI
jgi:hypothetical protein